MLTYYILILSPIILYYLSVRIFSKEIRCKIAITVFFAMLLLMLMLRKETVGRDVETYHLYFNGIAQTDWKYLTDINLETGFVYLNKIISSISLDFRLFLIVVALISVTPIWFLYWSDGEDVPTEIAVFITMSTFMMLFSGFRQSIAVSLGVIAYLFVKKKKLIFFLLTVVAALFFHNSAFILLLLYPLYHIKLKKRMLFIAVPIIGLIYLFNQPIFSFLSRFISDAHNVDKSITSTGAYSMILLLIAFAAFSFIIPNEHELTDEMYGLRNLLLLSVVIQLFAPINFLAMRMNYYFIVFIPVLVSKIVANPSVKWRQVAFLGKHVIIIALLLYFFIFSVRQNALDTFPYRFYWQ